MINPVRDEETWCFLCDLQTRHLPTPPNFWKNPNKIEGNPTNINNKNVIKQEVLGITNHLLPIDMTWTTYSIK
jgi:hypothetical protein